MVAWSLAKVNAEPPTPFVRGLFYHSFPRLPYFNAQVNKAKSYRRSPEGTTGSPKGANAL